MRSIRRGSGLRRRRKQRAPLDGEPPHRRGRWLTVRAKAEELYACVEDLIGGNLAYRWNVTPWMWDRRHADASPRERWQIDNATQAQPYLDALAAGRVTEALNLAGVAVDGQLAKLLRVNRTVSTAPN